LNDYELVTILHPDIKDEDVEATVDRLNQFVTGRGGEVREVDQWGRRRLAYPIARQFEGTYVVSHLQMQPANAAELEANLRISEEVLRHLLVRYSPAERAAAIAAMQRRRPRPAFDEQAGPGAPAPGEGAGGESVAEPAAALATEAALAAAETQPPEAATAPVAAQPTETAAAAAETVPSEAAAEPAAAQPTETAPAAAETVPSEAAAEPAATAEPTAIAATDETEESAAETPGPQTGA
jgi:small subunit ribosomal protein S6